MAAGHGMFVFLFRKLFFLYLEGLLLFLRRFPFFVERLDLPHQFQRWNKRDCQLWNFQSQLKWSQDNVVAEKKNRKKWEFEGNLATRWQCFFQNCKFESQSTIKVQFSREYVTKVILILPSYTETCAVTAWELVRNFQLLSNQSCGIQ